MLPSLASHVGNATTWLKCSSEAELSGTLPRGVSGPRVLSLRRTLLAAAHGQARIYSVCRSVCNDTTRNDITTCRGGNVPSASIIAVNREKQLRTSAMMMLLTC